MGVNIIRGPIARLWRIGAVILLIPVFATTTASSMELTAEERARSSELYRAFVSALSDDDREAAIDAIGTIVRDLPEEAAVTTRAAIADSVRKSSEDYAMMVRAAMEDAWSQSSSGSAAVEQDRALLAEILVISDEARQKERLAAEGWPALERLDEAMLPEPETVIARKPTIAARRDRLLFQLSVLDDLSAYLGVASDPSIRHRIEQAEQGPESVLEEVVGGSDRKVLAANREKAAQLSETEARGIKDANRIRLLAGFPALEIDLKLCEAARVHSVDMKEHEFFAHVSPVSGRREPWDRAREQGTTAHAENIAKGQRTARQANRGWFLSPGHFRNLFGEFKRIGLGEHERHWTQLFGL